MVGRCTIASDGAEGRKLVLVERTAERGLQNHKPRAPCVDVTEPGTEQAAAG
jgi:hypothetical protein